MDVALAASCAGDDIIRDALQRHLTSQRLDDLEVLSHRSLIDLLHCHNVGRTGFYDSLFAGAVTSRQRIGDLVETLEALKSQDKGKSGEGEQKEDGTRQDSHVLDQVIDIAFEAVGAYISSQTGGMIGQFLTNTLRSAVKAKMLSKGRHDTRNGDGKSEFRSTNRSEPQDSATARVINHVEAYCEVKDTPLGTSEVRHWRELTKRQKHA